MPTERVIDLRGRGPKAVVDPVLADPSGRRARRLRAAGRLVGMLFLLWLGGLALAGIGLLPAGQLPLGEAIKPSQAPPPLTAAPRASRTPVADRRPARPLIVAVRPRAATSSRSVAA